MSQSDQLFILHHYEASPYAEKIRAMFGLSGSNWGSVLSPPYPPRPNVDPLAGGYRRIPVAQLGADIFCDTALIASEVALHTGHAQLAPRVTGSEARALVDRAEGDVFFSAITSVPPLKLLGTLLLRNGPFRTLKFVRDRAGMMKGASVKPPQGGAAAQLFDEFLADLDRHLSTNSAVDGDQFSYADFCAYHPLWLALSVGGAKSLHQYSQLCDWHERMEALGHGGRSEISPAEAFDTAASVEPRALPTDGIEHAALGSDVTITPADYAKVGVAGKLVGATADRFILLRETERFGAVHVHFPQEGYTIV